MGQQSLYEHSVRVPLIFAGPGVPNGGRSDAFAYLLNIYPTLSNVWGIEAPSSVNGRSLSRQCKTRMSRCGTSSILAYTQNTARVHDHQHKLIEYHVNGERTKQLFDLEADPWELNNLAGERSVADTEARFCAQNCCVYTMNGAIKRAFGGRNSGQTGANPHQPRALRPIWRYGIVNHIALSVPSSTEYVTFHCKIRLSPRTFSTASVFSVQTPKENLDPMTAQLRLRHYLVPVLVVLALMAAGCVAPSEGPAAAEGDAGEVIELTFRQNDPPNQVGDLFERALAEFNESIPTST